MQKYMIKVSFNLLKKIHVIYTKKIVPRPVVSLPRATSFNDNVAMNLHHLKENLWYLYFIDEFSPFSTGATIRNKIQKQ